MAKKTNTKSQPASLTGDHYTLEQVANECIGFQTESETLKEKKGTISDHFMNAAQVYVKAPKKGEKMEDDHPFLVACKAQEKFSKSEKAGVNQWDKVPHAWSQMKSNIKQAFNFGIDINKYDTESSMRKDLNEARKAAKEADKSPEDAAREQVDGAIDAVVENGDVEISRDLFAIIEECKDLTPEQVDSVSKVLENTLNDIRVLKALEVDLKKTA